MDKQSKTTDYVHHGHGMSCYPAAWKKGDVVLPPALSTPEVDTFLRLQASTDIRRGSEMDVFKMSPLDWRVHSCKTKASFITTISGSLKHTPEPASKQQGTIYIRHWNMHVGGAGFNAHARNGNDYIMITRYYKFLLLSYTLCSFHCLLCNAYITMTGNLEIARSSMGISSFWLCVE